MNKDQIFAAADTTLGSFEFNDAVAAVFPDMLRRSIPGYETSIQAIAALASRYVQAGTRCYDLGCSLGAATLAMRQNIAVPDCEIIAVDQAPAMIERCRELVELDQGDTAVHVIAEDLRETEIKNASMVVMNYTLQFIPLATRLKVIEDIYAGMTPGGVFVLSEKIAHEDEQIEQLLTNLHHDFKRRNAYTDLEISRKRLAIENVLVPESARAHLQRLTDAGFQHASIWLKHFNFISIVAIR